MRRAGWNVVALAVVLAAVWLAKSSARPVARPASPARSLLEEHRATCGTPGARAKARAACVSLRARLRFRTLEALWTLSASADVRSVAVALPLLALDEEPAIQVAALRVLAIDPRQPGAAAAAARLLASPYPAVQEAAAAIVDRAGDEHQRRLAEQWRAGHPGGGDRGSLHFPDPDPAPPDLTARGLAPYPKAERFPPADAPNAVGWITSDPVETVAAFYGRTAGRPALDAAAWAKLADAARGEAGAGAQRALEGVMKGPVFQEIQRLAKEFERTQDPKLIAKIEELAKRLEAEVEAAQSAAKGALSPVFAVATPPGARSQVPWKTARFFVPGPTSAPVKAAVAVYGEDALGKQTVVQLIWDPR